MDYLTWLKTTAIPIWFARTIQKSQVVYWPIWKSIKIVDIISISDINILQVVSLEETLENTPNSDPKERKRDETRCY